jgi:hypothetical protein
MVAKGRSPKRKNFSSFTLASALKQLQVEQFHPWNLAATPLPVSDFLRERLYRLEKIFDLRGDEESKKLLIDALCEESILPCDRLKVWKGAALKSEELNGNVDYLIAENRVYLEAPMLCIAEAKKDDFEQGLGQCLVEMQACQWNNRQLCHSEIDVIGIVTNGNTWQFYKLTPDNRVYETQPHAIGDLEVILGYLQAVFRLCEQNLSLARGETGASALS